MSARADNSAVTDAIRAALRTGSAVFPPKYQRNLKTGIDTYTHTQTASFSPLRPTARRWTFDDRSSRGARQWAKFLAVNSCGGLVNYGVYALLVLRLNGLSVIFPVFAAGVGSICGLTINFHLSKRMVFEKASAKGHLKYPQNHRHEEPTQVKGRVVAYANPSISRNLTYPNPSKELYRIEPAA